MACPCFLPEQPDTAIPTPFPRPLGDLWTGRCGANGAVIGARHERIQLCNLGYAAGKCRDFPGGAADAVRFSVAADRGARIRLLWCAERDHLPFAHGLLDCEETGAAPPAADPFLAAQASAYLASYLRRRGFRSAS